MAQANFDTIMRHILRHEGGYVDHPRDPGGATNMGITFAVLQEWRGHPITKDDVKHLRQSEALDIYYANYWEPTHCSELPFGVDYVMMDGAVNSGTRRSAKWIQSVVGVAVDGSVGPRTLAAIEQHNPKKVIEAALDRRVAFLQRLSTWPTFGRGWLNRVTGVRNVATAMAED